MSTMMCRKDEEWKWKISSYHEKEMRDWDAKPYEKIEKTLFRWEIIVRIIPSNEMMTLGLMLSLMTKIFVWWRIDSSEELISLAVDDA